MNRSAMIDKLDKLKAEYDAFIPLKKEYEERLWKKFRLDWNYNSNHIEGNTLTYGQTELLLIFNKTTGDQDMREYEEMKAHDVAIKLIIELANEKERPLTESFIRQLNDLILVRPFWKEAITPDGQSTRKQIIPGEYKKMPNSVRLQNGEIFHYPYPEEVPALMKELMDYYNRHLTDSVKHPFYIAAMMHYKFVSIHPFDDGNGRVARLIMNYIFLKHGYPPVIIKAEKKEEYLAALRKADVGDTEAFVTYIEEQLIWSLETSIKAAKGESIEEPGDLDKKVELFKRSLKTKNKIITKSKQVIENVINDVYIKFLTSLDAELKRFEDLFKSTEWYYCKGATMALNTLDNNPFATDKLENIVNHLSGFAENGSESKYEVRLFYKRFNDEDDSFDLALVNDIQFSDKSYTIKRFLGTPPETSKFIRAISSLNLSLSEDGKIKIEFREIIVAEKLYNEIVTDDEIKSWAKKTADDLFAYIETKAQELDKRRKNK